MDYIGDIDEDSTVNVFFTTHDKNGGAAAPSTAFESADLLIYKNGGAGQKATTNGITMVSPFDSNVGLHLITIDTSNDTGDGGFWLAGEDYTIILTPDETVDGETIISAIAQFSIENRSALRPSVAGRTLAVAATGQTGVNFADINGSLDAGDIGANAFTAAKFASSCLTSAKFGGDFINAGSIADNAIGADQLATDAIGADAIASDAGAKIRGTVNGTADSGSSTTMVDNARTEGNDYWKGAAIRFTSGTLSGQVRAITGFVAASDTITFSPPVTTSVTTHTYELLDFVPDPWVRKLGNTTYSASAILQLNAGVLGGKISGLSTSTATIRDVEDATNLIVATVDADGNRAAVTITPPVD